MTAPIGVTRLSAATPPIGEDPQDLFGRVRHRGQRIGGQDGETGDS